MSYCRFIEGDACMIETDGEIVCCCCALNGCVETLCPDAAAAIAHLEAHRAAGHTVPETAFDRLRAEAADSARPVFSAAERAAEKQRSRDADAAALASGEKTRDDLRRENGAFTFLAHQPIDFDRMKAEGHPDFVDETVTVVGGERGLRWEPRAEEVVTVEDLLAKADALAARLNMTREEAFRRLDAGEFKGTIFESEMAGIRYLLEDD